MLASPGRLFGAHRMSESLLLLLAIIAAIIVYTIAKVIRLNRLSEQQWQDADKSKLREWDDDDDWQ